MLSHSGVFSSILCPDRDCHRPYCPYKHTDDVSTSSIEPFSSASSTSVVVSSEESSVASDYVGYVSTSQFGGGVPEDPYNPFLMTYNYTSSSTSYAPTAPTATYNTDSYIPQQYSYDPSAHYPGGSYNLEENNYYKPEVAPLPKQKRRDSSEFSGSSKPILPPDLGDDEILQFNKAKTPKEAVSMKAKKVAPKALIESQSSSRKRTDEANEYMKNVAAIDRQLDEMKRKRKQKLEEGIKRTSIDVDALFDVDDEPPPKKITKTSSSRDSTDCSKPSKTVPPPKTITLSSPKKAVVAPPDEDIIIISHKPPPAPKGSRVAHQPETSIPTMRKKPLLKDQLEARQKAFAAAPKTSSEQPTITSAFNKGQQRVAHVPKAAPPTPQNSNKNEPPTRPSLKDPNSRKLPIQLRQRILDKLVDEFIKFMPKSDAIITAQDEEYEMLQKSATRQGYCSSVTGVLRRIREMITTKSASKAAPGVSHLDVLKGRHVDDISIGVNKHQKKMAERVNEYSESELYEALFDKYLMTDEQLEDNGFPLWIDETKKEVKVKTSGLDAKNVLYVDPNNPIRTCCRCKATYKIKLRPDDVVENSDCVYHWGKFWKKKVQAQWIPRYTCCDMGEGVPGCSLAKQHVTQMQTTDIFKEFVEAPPRYSDFDERSQKIFALDCEMVYTSLGPAVARLSVVDYRGEKILDEIIKPPGELLDTNFRFSGLGENEVLNAKLNLAGAQERFFELINRDSILIGHSLESDLKSMRIVHRNVIDTSVLFPHRLGPPYKRALKNLSSEILMEIIQEDITGHDSAEDAQIALKLVLHKLKNE